MQPLQVSLSSTENSESQSSIIPAYTISENADGIHENGWKQHLQSQKTQKKTPIETTQPLVKDSSDKNPDYRSSPTYEEYLISKGSTTGIKKVEEKQPEDISKVHYLGESDRFKC